MSRVRNFLILIIYAVLLGPGGAWTSYATSADAATLTPTPRDAEGPFFKSGSPLRTSLLETGTAGKKLLLRGRVLSIAGAPIRNAKLDFWQADSNGDYDNKGFRLRGHQFTDDQGRYSLDTVVPGTYPGRPPHIHVTIQAPSYPSLTTQLYFPDHPGNRTDPLYLPDLQIILRDGPNGREAAFDFVLAQSRQ